MNNVLLGFAGLVIGLTIGFFAANQTYRANPRIVPASIPAPGTPVQPAPVTEADLQAAADRAKANPNDFDAQMRAADVHNQAQKFAESVAFLEGALKIRPDDYQTIINLGNVNFDGGKFEEAAKWYETALAKNPNDINARTDLGLTFVFRPTPDYDRAVKEFNRSLEINPKHIPTLQNTVVAYTRKRDAAKATEALKKFEAVDPTNESIAILRGEIQKIGTK